MNSDSFLQSSHGRFSCKGFTLLEVLVSSAILVVIMVLLIGIANHTTRLWSDGENRRDATREVRAGMEILTEDLHSAVFTTNPSTLMITREKGSDSNNRIFFLVTHPREKREAGNKGDLCATGYFIAPDSKKSALSSASVNLYRFHVSGDPVVKAISEDRLTELYDTASPTNSATTELLARNIVGLEIHRLGEGLSADPLLMISLSARGDGKGNKSVADQAKLYRCTTFVRLPPVREKYSTNNF